MNTYLVGTPQRHIEGVENRNEILNKRRKLGRVEGRGKGRFYLFGNRI